LRGSWGNSLLWFFFEFFSKRKLRADTSQENINFFFFPLFFWILPAFSLMGVTWGRVVNSFFWRDSFFFFISEKICFYNLFSPLDGPIAV
jgi:hypothetical protein